jgi:DNA invertase Pin-like site-specific DNA recombinase
MAAKARSSAVSRTIALCYVRKSWNRDENDAVSPERQRDHIQAVCDSNGWTPEWYSDTDKHRSGMHEKGRPGWLALKARLGAPDVVALVTNDLARLHRKGWRVGDLLEFVDQHNMRLVLADPRRQIDFSTPHGRMMAQLSAIFDEWYAADISERWKASIAHRKGKGVTVGRPPFGTKRDKKTGYLIPSPEGAWLIPDGTWIAGKVGEESPLEGAVWRGYFECAERVLRLYAERWAGRERITQTMQEEGWAYRDKDGKPAPFEVDDVRRITNNWIEYGGAVLGTRAKERHPHDYDPSNIKLIPERAVFDVTMLYKVGMVQKERTRRAPDRGQAKTDHPYPLSALTYCAHCARKARVQNDVKLLSRLGGKSKSRYRHKAGASCGCTRKSITREVYEGDFLRLIRLLTIRPEWVEYLTRLASQAHAINAKSDQDMEAQRTAAIAKCRRRIEAARHQYEDGEMERPEYLRRKEQNEREISQWEAYSTETEKLSVELAVCLDALDKLARLWETSGDEDKQGMARNLFNSIVVDLDKQQIVDFELKPWADRFLVLRHALYMDGTTGDQAASGNVAGENEGTNGTTSPVRVT